MADVKWIKICTDIFDDEKMILLDSIPEHDAIIVIWFKLLCMAGKQNNGGVFMLSDKIAYTDEMLATIFHRPINIVRLALTTFEKFGMIEIVNNTYTIPNWEKHQSLDKLEQLKEQNRARVAKHREKQRLLSGEDECNVTVTLCNAIDIDKDKNKKENKNIIIEPEKKKPKRKPFVPPTLEEVQAYCLERKNNVDAKKFFDYYETSDWYDGKGNKVKSWKQKVITWERDGDNKKGNNQKNNKNDGWCFNQNEDSLDDLF